MLAMSKVKPEFISAWYRLELVNGDGIVNGPQDLWKIGVEADVGGDVLLESDCPSGTARCRVVSASRKMKTA